jgi:glycine oxidase
MSATGKVVVVGGGIIGLSVADRLAREGVAVTVLERGVCGRESSWAAAGVLKPSNPNRRGPMQELQRASLAIFADYCADLRERTGVDAEYRQCGSIELLFDDQRYRMARSEERAGAEQALITADNQPEWQMLTVVEARELEPCLAEECLGALLCRFSAQARNPRLLRALVKACLNNGVQIREHTAAAGLATSGSRVSGLQPDDGTVAADAVALCAGAWSSQLDRRLEALTPVHPVRGQVVLLDASDAAGARFEHIVDRKGCYLVPRSDGLVLVGATVEPESGYDRRATAAGVQGLMTSALSLVPGLAEAGVVGVWAGLRPGTPDRRPFLGQVPGVEGLVAATGHYRTGLALAPVTAEVVADLVLRGSTSRDISRCQPGRSS